MIQKMNNWKETKLMDFMLFNPKEKLDRDIRVKKISMDKLQPFTRGINHYEYAFFRGGVKFRNGDTLMARITPCLENGKIAQVGVLDKNEIGFGSTEFIAMREIEGVSNNKFIYYLVCSPLVRDIAIQSMVGSSGRQRVQQNVLEELELRLPSLPEQKAIAATLSCLDDKIELNNQMNDTLEQMAQAIFKSWFVDFEPFQDGEFEDSELGKIPKGWKVGALSELFEFKNGKKRPQEDGKYPVYGGNGILGHSAINNNENIIAIGRVGAYCGSLYFVPGKCWISDNAIAARSRQNSNIFCYYTLKYLRLNERRIGTGQPLLTQGILNNILFVIPKDEYISGFDERMDSIFKQIYSNKRQNKFLSRLRDTLLPKLMSGEIRVPVESAE
jgi:type I restriction enzyme S subunit